MATINIRCTQIEKEKLEAIAKLDNRSLSKEVIQLIENRYAEMSDEL